MTGNPACDSYKANGWDVTVVTTDSGETLATCLNPFNSTDQNYQKYIGYSIAGAATATFALLSVIGIVSFLSVRRSFRNLVQFSEGGSSPANRQKIETVQMLPVGGRGSAETGK